METQLSRCREMSAKATEISQQATQLLSHTKDAVEQEDGADLEAVEILRSHKSNISENTEINPFVEMRTPERFSSESVAALHQNWQVISTSFTKEADGILNITSDFGEELLQFLEAGLCLAARRDCVLSGPLHSSEERISNSP